MIAALYEWWHMVAEALIQKMGVIVVQTSPLVTRNVTVSGRRTSVRLEPDLWEALNEIATHEGRSVHQICVDIEQARGNTCLTSSMRTYIVNYFRSAANPS
jgi:predicted DNA-binding ribbon-helix-helix protein